MIFSKDEKTLGIINWINTIACDEPVKGTFSLNIYLLKLEVLPFKRVNPKPKITDEIFFLFLRYWGLCHNWNKAFVFDGRYGVKAYLRKLKGVFM